MGPIGVDIKGLGEAAGGLANAGVTLVNGIRTAITGVDVQKQAELEKAITDYLAAQDAHQAKINEVEAASARFFVAGWRPALGWILDAAAFCYFLPKFVAIAVLWILQVVRTGVLTAYPDAGWQEVATLLLGMLGIAGMRTWEKKLGVQGNH